jgi:hypothetical protein
LRDFYSNVGGRFDYRFDLATPDCVFCVELIERVLPELDMPVREVYGRKLIVPDELVRAAVEGDPSVAFVAYVRADRQQWQRASREELRRDLADNWNH